MPVFKVEGRVTFSGYQYITKEISAENERQAEKIFKDYDHYIEGDDFDIQDVDIEKTECIDEDREKTYRCEDTKDMFS